MPRQLPGACKDTRGVFLGFSCKAKATEWGCVLGVRLHSIVVALVTSRDRDPHLTRALITLGVHGCQKRWGGSARGIIDKKRSPVQGA